MRRLVLLPALLAFLVGAVPALAWTWPVAGPVLRPFALEGNPYAAGQHRGIDIAADEGAAVLAPSGGTVTFAGTVPTGGRSVTIKTSDGFALTLLHLGAIVVAEGDAVAEGAQVGVAGWSGDAEHQAPSVHLGVRIAADASAYVDPLLLLPSRGGIQPVVEEDDTPSADAPPAQDGEEAAATPTETGSQPLQPSEDGTPPEAAVDVGVEAAVPIGAGVAPLEPLTIVAGESTAAPGTTSAQAAPLELMPIVSGEIAAPPSTMPTQAASLEASGQTPGASAPASVEAAPAAATASGVTEPVAAASPAPSAADSASTTDQVGDRAIDDRRRRARRSRPLRSAAATDPATATAVPPSSVRTFDPSPPVAADPRGPAAGETARTVRHTVVAGAAARDEASGGGEWLSRAPLVALAALCALVAIGRRRGRGEPDGAGAGHSPSQPPAGTAQPAGVSESHPVARPVLRPDPRLAASRPGRRLERGGPGTPARPPTESVRGRRASV
jgi:hypothetical protein